MLRNRGDGNVGSMRRHEDTVLHFGNEIGLVLGVTLGGPTAKRPFAVDDGGTELNLYR